MIFTYIYVICIDTFCICKCDVMLNRLWNKKHDAFEVATFADEFLRKFSPSKFQHPLVHSIHGTDVCIPTFTSFTIKRRI